MGDSGNDIFRLRLLPRRSQSNAEKRRHVSAGVTNRTFEVTSSFDLVPLVLAMPRAIGQTPRRLRLIVFTTNRVLAARFRLRPAPSSLIFIALVQQREVCGWAESGLACLLFLRMDSCLGPLLQERRPTLLHVIAFGFENGSTI
jgi:hypothetical protein